MLQNIVTTLSYSDDLYLLTDTLPQDLQDALLALPSMDLLEVVMDLGRPAQARFPGYAVNLSEQSINHDDLRRCVAAIGEFSADNRAGIEGTLHRISALRNRRGQIIGLTLRVGRAVFGTIDLIRDLVERGVSVLLLGPPGIGKTTKLREIARVLADEASKRVMVIDTSNEIAGDGDIPHPAIGGARRMQVPHPEQQHALMIEAVENHMPEVIIVDEIGTAAEALAARTIAERGVQLIGTAHGNTLENLLLNPTLCDLVGGIQTVTLSDDEARLRRTQKTVSERKAAPTFDAVVEIVDRDEVIIHADTAEAVDKLLFSVDPGGLSRRSGGDIFSVLENQSTEKSLEFNDSTPQHQGPIRIFPYGISNDSIERVIRDLRLNARLVKRAERAHCIVALRARVDDVHLRRILQATGLPLHLVKRNSTSQLRRVLESAFNVIQGIDGDRVTAAVHEVEAGVKRVQKEGVAVALAPQSAELRKLQHRLVVRNRLLAESIGSEPQRHLVIHPNQ